ncbi:MAG: tyrosine-type recombinase/integrase [Bacteroidetes bacterium]|nr:tyrosine-type recombinase/integrase [Bacteroidota bacterium]
MHFTEASNRFLHFLRFEKRYSEHTLDTYQRCLLQFEAFYQSTYGEEAQLTQLNHHHFRSWLAAIIQQHPKTKPTTLRLKTAALSSFFHFAQQQGFVDKNPLQLLHSFRLPKRLPVAIEQAQAEKLIQDLAFDKGFRGSTDRLICELLYSTGMRRQELLNLRETDIAWGQKLLRVLGKGNKERMLPLGTALLDLLRDYIAEKKRVLARPNREFLLVLENGKPLYASYVYRVVHHYLSLVSSQEKRSPHVLRHSFATHLLANGANIQAIKDLLGHSSLAATQIYTHNDVARLKEIHKSAHPRG